MTIEDFAPFKGESITVASVSGQATSVEASSKAF